MISADGFGQKRMGEMFKTGARRSRLTVKNKGVFGVILATELTEGTEKYIGSVQRTAYRVSKQRGI